jgi:transposase InsO family protein
LRDTERLTYAAEHVMNFWLALLDLAVMTAKLCSPGGVRAVIAENLVLKQQLLVLRRGRWRAPNLTPSDRLLCGFSSLFLRPSRVRKLAIVVRPSTLLGLQAALVRRKYRRLFSAHPHPRKPGPKGPSEALIRAIVELKSRNPRFACPRIARIIACTFGVDVDRNVVRRVLAQHYRPSPDGTGPSWLSLIGHTTDSLWRVDLFRCESLVLRTSWVLVVMDQFTRRIVGVGVHAGAVTGIDLCRMFNAAIHGYGVPRRLSTDHDPLFEAHRWQANLRILEIDELKTVPYVPCSHPFVADRHLPWGQQGAAAGLLGRVRFSAQPARQPMAAFQTLLGLGTTRGPTPYRTIRGAGDAPRQAD